MVPKNYGNLVRKPGIKKAVIEVITGKKTMGLARITEAVNELLPGVDVDKVQVQQALAGIRQHPPQGVAPIVQPDGNRNRYKLVPSKRPSRNGPIPDVDPEEAGKMVIDALPLINECIEIMKKPVVGREQTLALDHLWKVRQMLDHLLVPGEVV